MSDNRYHDMFWEEHRQNEELRTVNTALRAEVGRLGGSVATIQRLGDEIMHLKLALRRVVEAAQHLEFCSFPEEVRFRCESCQRAQEALAFAKGVMGE